MFNKSRRSSMTPSTSPDFALRSPPSQMPLPTLEPGAASSSPEQDASLER
ncbi:hypothetical protein HanPSC8_Chr16g0725091 [Helianthus annuus]|nr:hypothetical protein HanPSC8_Chr16g0725091 [Helianthus annuus]